MIRTIDFWNSGDSMILFICYTGLPRSTLKTQVRKPSFSFLCFLSNSRRPCCHLTKSWCGQVSFHWLRRSWFAWYWTVFPAAKFFEAGLSWRYYFCFCSFPLFSSVVPASRCFPSHFISGVRCLHRRISLRRSSGRCSNNIFIFLLHWNLCSWGMVWEQIRIGYLSYIIERYHYLMGHWLGGRWSVMVLYCIYICMGRFILQTYIVNLFHWAKRPTGFILIHNLSP